jgi:DNA-binding MurR/RpiR family transcriptional regulator
MIFIVLYDGNRFSHSQSMKADMSKDPASWSADADRRFTASPLGRQVLELLHAGSPSQKQLSEFVLRDPVFVATHGIEDMARASGISASTLSRYVRDLGFVGYAEFRAGVGETVHALIAPVAKLGERLAQPDPSGTPAQASLASAALNLQGLGDTKTSDTIREVAHRVKSARAVWVMGFGLSAHLAAILALGLQPYRDGVVNVVQFGGTEVAAGRLMSAGPGDVVIAIAFPRYSSDIANLARAARKAGARIISLTDSVVSPLAAVSDDLLLAPAQHPVLSASSLPGLAVIEALISEFLLLDPKHLERSRLLAGAMAAYLAVQS